MRALAMGLLRRTPFRIAVVRSTSRRPSDLAVAAGAFVARSLVRLVVSMVVERKAGSAM